MRKEQASNTAESHGSYRRDREQRREKNAQSDPIYDFSRDLVKFALIGADVPTDLPNNIRLNVSPY